jgi:hypothetical protein
MKPPLDRIEMCVCTLLNANSVVERVGAHALEGKNKFTESHL